MNLSAHVSSGGLLDSPPLFLNECRRGQCDEFMGRPPLPAQGVGAGFQILRYFASAISLCKLFDPKLVNLDEIPT